MAYVSAGGYPSPMPALPDIVRSTVTRFSMLPEGSVVVVMVSGGADSTCLLRLLAQEDIVLGLQLSVLHVHHGLRGDDADADAEFVARVGGELGVPVRVERVDVAGFAAEHGLNLEDAGRIVRYRLADEELDDRCSRAGVSPAQGRIAVAHTRDDRTETFLMRLAQGAGAGGLTTLKPVRDRIVRPLIEAPRAAVREYLSDLGQDWREDATNADTARLRARVRHELLTLMRDINPRFDDALARSVDLLAQEDALLDEMATAFARDFARVDGERVEFDVGMMLTLSLPMRRRTVRKAVFTVFPQASRLEFAHVEALVDGLGTEGFARDLPGGLRAEVRYGTMAVSRAVEGDRSVAPGLLMIPGTVDLGEAGTLSAEPVDPRFVDEGLQAITVDAATLEPPLLVSAPREGDRLQPLGMTGTKKVSDLLVDEKVPKGDRPGIPIVRSGDGIVWVAGVRMGEQYKVTEATREAVRLTWDRCDDLTGAAGERERNETTDAS